MYNETFDQCSSRVSCYIVNRMFIEKGEVTYKPTTEAKTRTNAEDRIQQIKLIKCIILHFSEEIALAEHLIFLSSSKLITGFSLRHNTALGVGYVSNGKWCFWPQFGERNFSCE